MSEKKNLAINIMICIVSLLIIITACYRNHKMKRVIAEITQEKARLSIELDRSNAELATIKELMSRLNLKVFAGEMEGIDRKLLLKLADGEG